ncbi:MAG: hypothetical protein ACRD4E_16635 [Bryobacteraceae bacterium]
MPTAAGSANGNLVLTDNSNPTSQSIALQGTSGTPAEAYTLTVSNPKVSMTAGTNGTATLMLSSSNYAGTVSFNTAVSSTNGTPADVTATASPVTLTAGGTGTSTLTITANANAANHSPTAPWNAGTMMFCAALLGAPFTLRRKHLLSALPLVLVICLAGFLMACGGAVSSMDPPAHTQGARTYVVTVTPMGTAGAVTVTNPAAVTITVTVQ